MSEIDIPDNQLNQLDKILTFVDKRYKEIYFDVEVEERPQKRILFTILVSDLKFYLEDLDFKKISRMLKKKFSIYFIFAFRGNAFNNN